MDTQVCPSCRNPVPITLEMGGNKWVTCACGTEFAAELNEVRQVRRAYVPPEPDCSPFRVQPLQKLTPVFKVEATPAKHSTLPHVMIGAALVCVVALGLAIAYTFSGDAKKSEQIAASVPPLASSDRSPRQDMPAARDKALLAADDRHSSDSDVDPELTLPDLRADDEPAKKIEKPANSALDAALADLNGTVDDKRVAAAKRLAAMGENANGASRALCRAMMDASEKVRKAAGDALAAVNPSLYKPVNTILTDPSPRKAKAAFDTLAMMGSRGEPSVDVLLAAVQLPGPIFLPGPTSLPPASESPGPSTLPPATRLPGPSDLAGPVEQAKPSSLQPAEKLPGPTVQPGPTELPGVSRLPGPTTQAPPSKLPPATTLPPATKLPGATTLPPASRQAPPTRLDSPRALGAVMGRGTSQVLHSQPAVWVRTVAGVAMGNQQVIAALTRMMTAPQNSTNLRALSALALSRASDKITAASALAKALKVERNPSVALAMIHSIKLIGPIANQTAASTLNAIKLNGSTESLKNAATQALIGIGGYDS